jgi:hypothetical protein
MENEKMTAEPFITGRGWENLSCDDQFSLARQIAANVGYVLTPEPEIEPFPCEVSPGKTADLAAVVRDLVDNHSAQLPPWIKTALSGALASPPDLTPSSSPLPIRSEIDL